ncbi:MAG: hypothetical protein Q7J54_06700 [Candidatus Woesearchaeota archaeon]|nr:hypothetical protein [Candidatus Woesearchaeota archaeon]
MDDLEHLTKTWKDFTAKAQDVGLHFPESPDFIRHNGCLTSDIFKVTREDYKNFTNEERRIIYARLETEHGDKIPGWLGGNDWVIVIGGNVTMKPTEYRELVPDNREIIELEKQHGNLVAYLILESVEIEEISDTCFKDSDIGNLVFSLN